MKQVLIWRQNFLLMLVGINSFAISGQLYAVAEFVNTGVEINIRQILFPNELKAINSTLQTVNGNAAKAGSNKVNLQNALAQINTVTGSLGVTDVVAAFNMLSIDVSSGNYNQALVDYTNLSTLINRNLINSNSPSVVSVLPLVNEQLAIYKTNLTKLSNLK